MVAKINDTFLLDNWCYINAEFSLPFLSSWPLRKWRKRMMRMISYSHQTRETRALEVTVTPVCIFITYVPPLMLKSGMATEKESTFSYWNESLLIESRCVKNNSWILGAALPLGRLPHSLRKPVLNVHETLMETQSSGQWQGYKHTPDVSHVCGDYFPHSA